MPSFSCDYTLGLSHAHDILAEGCLPLVRGLHPGAFPGGAGYLIAGPQTMVLSPV